MVAFLLISVMIVLWVQQWMLENVADFVDANFWPEENVVDQEDYFNIIVELKNKKAFPVYFIRVAMTFPKEFTVSEKAKITEKRQVHSAQQVSVSTWLKANQTLKIKIPVSLNSRGRFFLPNPVLYFGDFLGLKEKSRELSLYREVVAAPKSCDTDQVKQVLGRFLGEYSVRRFIYEDPVLTVGFRRYTGREPMKMISWKQSASKQQLMVKEYDHTIEPVLSVVVNLETVQERQAEITERLYSIARSVCSNLEAKGISYSFHINALMAGGSGEMHFVNDGVGRHHFGKIMERLGRGMHIHRMSFENLLQDARKTNGDRGLIIITPDTTATQSAAADSGCLVLDASQF